MAIQYINGQTVKNNNHGVIKGTLPDSSKLAGTPIKAMNYDTSAQGRPTIVGKTDSQSFKTIHQGSTTPKDFQSYTAYETSPSGNYIGGSGVYEGKTTAQSTFSNGVVKNSIVVNVGKPKLF